MQKKKKTLKSMQIAQHITQLYHNLCLFTLQCLMPAAVNATRSCTSLRPPAAPVVILTLNAAVAQKVAVKKTFDVLKSGRKNPLTDYKVLQKNKTKQKVRKCKLQHLLCM